MPNALSHEIVPAVDEKAGLIVSQGDSKLIAGDEESLISPTDLADKALIVCGTDKRGCPVLIGRPSLHIATSEEESMQAVEECMGTVQQAMNSLPHGEHKIGALFDLDGAGYRNLDMTFVQALLERLNREFPDCLDQAAVVNGHWSIQAAWSAVQFFLSTETQEKVAFYGDDDLEKLEEFIDSDHVYMKHLRTGQEARKAQCEIESEEASYFW